jgi:hypothetical protein
MGNSRLFSKPGIQHMLAGILLLCISGCASAVVVSGMGAAPSGVSQASGFGSKVVSFQIVHYQDAVEATILAAKSLSLAGEEEKMGDKRSTFRYMDEKGQNIAVVIERRTETVTAFSVDAGFFGSRAMTRLVLRQIIDEIADAGNFLEDWRIDN